MVDALGECNLGLQTALFLQPVADSLQGACGLSRGDPLPWLQFGDPADFLRAEFTRAFRLHLAHTRGSSGNDDEPCFNLLVDGVPIVVGDNRGLKEPAFLKRALHAGLPGLDLRLRELFAQGQPARVDQLAVTRPRRPALRQDGTEEEIFQGAEDKRNCAWTASPGFDLDGGKTPGPV